MIIKDELDIFEYKEEPNNAEEIYKKRILCKKSYWSYQAY